MIVNLRRPILVGGIGLSLILWLWDAVGESAVELGETAIFGAMAVGGGLWWLQRQLPKSDNVLTASPPINREMTEAAIVKTETAINQLATEAETMVSGNYLDEAIAALRSELINLKTLIDRQGLRLAITGTQKVGKTALKQVLEGTSWTDESFESFTITEVSEDCLSNLVTADLVLFLVDGDITDPEYQIFCDLCDRQRTLLVWNKQDKCPLANQVVVLEKLRQTVVNRLASEDVIGVSASPSPIKVRKYEDEGAVQEWMESQLPEIETLTQNLHRIFTHEGKALVLATTYREAMALQDNVKTHLNTIRRQRAMPMVEQYQWVAAAAAFANPVPALDILSTAAIGTQLVIDLGKIYDCQFSLEQAQEVTKTLGSQMVKLGLVELSTKTLTAVLKSNTVTYVAGGVIQGVTAAYLTRIAALSLIEYFQSQETKPSGFSLNIDSFKNIIESVFRKNQQLSTLQTFAKQAISHGEVTEAVAIP